MAADVATWVASWVRTTWAPSGSSGRNACGLTNTCTGRVARRGSRRPRWSPPRCRRTGPGRRGERPRAAARSPGTSTTRCGVQPGSTRRTCGTAVRASPATRSASAAPPWTRTSVSGERRTWTGPGQPQRRPPVSTADARDAPGVRRAGRSGPGPPCSRPGGRSRRSATRPGRTPRRRRRGPLPRPGRRSAARSPPRGAPARCGRPRTGRRPPRRRTPAAAPTPGRHGRRRSPGRAGGWPPGPGTPARSRDRSAARGTSSRAGSARPRARRRGPGTARGRPPTNGGDRPLPACSGACSEARGQPGRTAPTYGIM